MEEIKQMEKIIYQEFDIKNRRLDNFKITSEMFEKHIEEMEEKLKIIKYKSFSIEIIEYDRVNTNNKIYDIPSTLAFKAYVDVEEYKQIK